VLLSYLILGISAVTSSQNPASSPTKAAADPALFDLLVLGSGIAGLACGSIGRR
jgi:hypothetical protein